MIRITVIHTLRVHYAHAAANLNSGYSKYAKVARVHYFCTIALRTSRAVMTRAWASRRVDFAKFEFDRWFHFFINKELSENRISPKTMTSLWCHQMCMNGKLNEVPLFDISVWCNRSFKTKLHPMIVRQYSHLKYRFPFPILWFLP